jgi:serine O-acetyltransferase
MLEHIREDILRVHKAGNHQQDETLGLMDILRALSSNVGLQVLVIYRFGQWLRNRRSPTLPRMVTSLLYPLYRMLAVCGRLAYGINLEQSADIGPGLYIGHFGGIEVKNCCIGPNCAIHNQIVLGPMEPSADRLRIGAGVWIGAHSQIRANIQVGDGATIGAGSVVTEDVPRQCLVVGNPSRITAHDYDNRPFL